MKQHYPVVEIQTPRSRPGHELMPAILTMVIVDGEMWPVTAYSVGADKDGWQEVTLTFHADVTIEHQERRRSTRRTEE